jgi:hypothetical protein
LKPNTLTDGLGQLLFADRAGTKGIDEHGDRLGIADGVGQLHFAPFSQTCGHNVLGDIAGHVGGAAIHLGGILAGEGAATVTAHAAVGVDDDLAAGQTAVALGSARHETAGRVDQVTGLAVNQFLRSILFDNFFDDAFGEFGLWLTSAECCVE